MAGCFFRHGKRVLTEDASGHARILDFDTGRLLLETDPGKDTPVNYAHRSCLSDDETRIIAVMRLYSSLVPEGLLKIAVWDASAGTLKATAGIPITKTFETFLVSPNGAYFIPCTFEQCEQFGFDNEIETELIRIEDGRSIAKLKGNRFAFSPDGTKLLVWKEDEGLSFFDTSTGERIHEMKSESIRSLHFASSNRVILVAEHPTPSPPRPSPRMPYYQAAVLPVS